MTLIPMIDLKREYAYIKEEIDTAIHSCLEHQKWIQGPEVKEFEKQTADFLSIKHCLAVSSGTDALVLALRALSIKLTGKEYFCPDDKIITTPWTFTATGDAILRSGATPVFVDIDPSTFNIDPNKIKEALSSIKGIVGILPVHIYGQSCDMDAIMDMARNSNVFILEDTAQAFGAKWNEQYVGTFGDVGSFSFFPTKILGGFGDGGMISTQDDILADIIQILQKHGGRNKYNADYIGYNARLDTIQAAVLLVKLKYIEEFNKKKRSIAQIYDDMLSKNEYIKIPYVNQKASHVYCQYTIRATNGKRDVIREYLKDNNIETMLYYPVLLNEMNIFKNRCEVCGELDASRQSLAEGLSLPIGPLLDEDEVVLVCNNLENAICPNKTSV